jgi:hypothetical protein
VQIAALNALRNIPGAEVDNHLLAIVNAAESSDLVRMTAATLLKERKGESEVSIAAVDVIYAKAWDRTFGSTYLGVKFPGILTATTPTIAKGLTAFARQDIDGYVWKNKINLLAGSVQTAPATTTTQKFAASLEVGNRFYMKSYSTILPCSASKSGTLYQTTLNLVNTGIKIPVLSFITIAVSVKATGNFSVGYSFQSAVCNSTNMQVKASIKPSAYVKVTAEGSLTLVVVRGGIGLSATLLNGSIPATATLGYKVSTPSLCLDVRAQTTALSGKIYGFADAGIDYIFGSTWKRVFSGNLVTFSTGAQTANILVKCY